MNTYNTQNLRIDPMAFQHPQNKLLADELNADKGFNQIVEFISKNSTERELHVLYVSSYFRGTEKSMPKYFKMLNEACEMFGVAKKPEVFFARDYGIYSKTIGIDNPMTLTSLEALTTMSDLALWGFVASSVSMLRTNYCVVRSVENFLPIAKLLIPQIAFKPLSFLLAKWRASMELSNDRAALVATGDFNAAIRQMLAGEMPREALERIDFSDPNCEFMQQCKQYADMQAGKIARAARNVNIITNASIPYATRYLELYKFYTNDVAAGDIGFCDLADNYGFEDLTVKHMQREGV